LIRNGDNSSPVTAGSPERLQGEFTGSIHRFAPPTGSLKNLPLLLLLFTAFVQNCESHHKKTGSVRQLFCFSWVAFERIKRIETVKRFSEVTLRAAISILYLNGASPCDYAADAAQRKILDLAG
jgi:hypothetical protein